MSDAFEVTPVATVIGGHATPMDDYQGGVESIIHLDASTAGNAPGHRGALPPLHGHLALPLGVAQRRGPACLLAERGTTAMAGPAETFVHRNHRRPNQFAASYPRLLRVDGRDLHITEPRRGRRQPCVIDLAPYFPAMGPHGPIQYRTGSPKCWTRTGRTQTTADLDSNITSSDTSVSTSPLPISDVQSDPRPRQRHRTSADSAVGDDPRRSSGQLDAASADQHDHALASGFRVARDSPRY